MKNLEWGFRRVMCLSGCLTAYRRAVLVDARARAREALGARPSRSSTARDRFLTRQIVKAGYMTTMTLDARCRTFVPSTLSAYFSSSCGGAARTSSTTRAGSATSGGLNPVLAIHFFSLFALLLVYPIAV